MSKRKFYRSGFIYAAAHPENQDLVKIGFTRKSPITRLKDLSKTSNRQDFVFLDGRWVFDAIYCESKTHKVMSDKGFTREKEFFHIVDREVISEVFNYMEIEDEKYQQYLLNKNSNQIVGDEGADMGIDSEFDFQWRVDDLSHRFSYVRKQGIGKIESLSSKGFGMASICLAEHCMNEGPISVNRWKMANCLYMAAKKQGEQGCDFRSLYWRTMVETNHLDRYFSNLWDFKIKMDNGQHVPDIVKETIKDEADFQKSSITRARQLNKWLGENNHLKIRKPPGPSL